MLLVRSPTNMSSSLHQATMPFQYEMIAVLEKSKMFYLLWMSVYSKIVTSFILKVLFSNHLFLRHWKVLTPYKYL